MTTKLTKDTAHASIDRNFARVQVGDLVLWFSYQTLIGFWDTEKVAIQNYWNKTTGKHLNTFSDKADRVNRETFDAKWAEVLKKHKLVG